MPCRAINPPPLFFLINGMLSIYFLNQEISDQRTDFCWYLQSITVRFLAWMFYRYFLTDGVLPGPWLSQDAFTRNLPPTLPPLFRPVIHKMWPVCSLIILIMLTISCGTREHTVNINIRSIKVTEIWFPYVGPCRADDAGWHLQNCPVSELWV